MTTPKHDPSARKHAIGDFARKAGVSTHFLEFYEEKGINNCTEQEAVEMLEQRENVMQTQLRTQQMYLQGLQNLRVALRFCEQNEWSVRTVRTVPDVWYLPHTIGREFAQDDCIWAGCWKSTAVGRSRRKKAPSGGCISTAWSAPVH